VIIFTTELDQHWTDISWNALCSCYLCKAALKQSVLLSTIEIKVTCLSGLCKASKRSFGDIPNVLGG